MKILESRKYEIEGVVFTPGFYPIPDLGEVGTEVEMADVPSIFREQFIRSFKLRKELNKMSSEKADKDKEKRKKIESAKWTVLIGHRIKCGGRNPVHFTTFSKGGGMVMSVLDGGHNIEPLSNREVYHPSSLGELVEVFGGKLKSNKILTKNPGFVIGKGGVNVKFLSDVAGVRLKVVEI